MNTAFSNLIQSKFPPQEADMLLKNMDMWEWLFDEMMRCKIEAQIQHAAYDKFHELAANTITDLHVEISKLKDLIRTTHE